MWANQVDLESQGIRGMFLYTIILYLYYMFGEDAYNFDSEKVAELLKKCGANNREEIVAAWQLNKDVGEAGWV